MEKINVAIKVASADNWADFEFYTSIPTKWVEYIDSNRYITRVDYLYDIEQLIVREFERQFPISSAYECLYLDQYSIVSR